MKSNYIITGEDTTNILNIVKPGDIILRNFNNFFNIFLFREYLEGCIYIGNHKIIKSFKNNIVVDNIISYLRCDKLLILRIDETKILNYNECKQKAIDRSYQFFDVAQNVDFTFNLECHPNFEIPIFCYFEFGFLKRFNVKYRKYVYDDFSLLNTPYFKIIYKKDSKTYEE